VSFIAGWHSPALLVLGLGLCRIASTEGSVIFFKAKNQDIANVAVMKF
jgi:hypothetical protein